MKPEINYAHCQEFITSMQHQDENDDCPAGVVEGILVKYSAFYLQAFFGWDGSGVVTWNDSCRCPEPNIATFVGDTPMKRGKYDVFHLGHVKREPWFCRIRRILSQIFFPNDCNSVHPDHLHTIILADLGERINWGMIVDQHFRIQLRGYRRIANYSNPIDPFLSAYIARYLDYYRKHNHPPRMGSFLDVQREFASRTSLPPMPQDTPESSHKRQRVVERELQFTTAVDANWGPCTLALHEQCITVTRSLDAITRWIHTVEQEQCLSSARQAQLEERYQTKLAHDVQTIQAAAAQSTETLRREFAQQLEATTHIAQQASNRVTTLELELEALREN
jgi:hypothetical protein